MGTITDNQLEFVRQHLQALPRDQWPAMAESANLTQRTLYNVVNAVGNPRYDSVYSLFIAIKAREAGKPKRGRK